MQNFAYTARDGSGAAVNGVIVAESIAEASKLLRGEGKYPTSVRAASETPVGSPNTPETVAAPAIGKGGVKITRQEVIQFSTQLAIMIETGVHIDGNGPAMFCGVQRTDFDWSTLKYNPDSREILQGYRDAETSQHVPGERGFNGRSIDMGVV